MLAKLLATAVFMLLTATWCAGMQPGCGASETPTAPSTYLILEGVGPGDTGNLILVKKSALFERFLLWLLGATPIKEDQPTPIATVKNASIPQTAGYEVTGSVGGGPGVLCIINQLWWERFMLWLSCAKKDEAVEYTEES